MYEYVILVATQKTEFKQYYKTRKEALTAFNSFLYGVPFIATVDTLIELYRCKVGEFDYHLTPIKSKFISIP